MAQGAGFRHPHGGPGLSSPAWPEPLQIFGGEPVGGCSVTLPLKCKKKREHGFSTLNSIL